MVKELIRDNDEEGQPEKTIPKNAAYHLYVSQIVCRFDPSTSLVPRPPRLRDKSGWGPGNETNLLSWKLSRRGSGSSGGWYSCSLDKTKATEALQQPEGLEIISLLDLFFDPFPVRSVF